MFNGAYIDSLKVRVRMEHIAIIDKRIVTDFIRYYPSLEQLDDDNQPFIDEQIQRHQPFTEIVNGITYRFYPKAFINAKKIAEEYMVFQLSAKMAKHKYFQGITLENISQIVDDINSFNVIRVTKEKLLQGLWSDCDICKNQLLDERGVNQLFSTINDALLPGKAPLVSTFRRADNTGMEFNKREKANNSLPYCKIYHKGKELLSKSVVFYKQYLEPMEKSVIDNLLRFEYTIKAHKHKEYLREKGFNVPERTLKDLLSAPMSDLNKILSNGLMSYIEPRSKSVIDTENSPIDIMLSYYIENLMKLGYPTDKLLGFTELIQDASSRSRAKSKANKLIKTLLDKDRALLNKAVLNDKVHEFLRNLGIDLP